MNHVLVGIEILKMKEKLLGLYRGSQEHEGVSSGCEG